EAAGDAEELLRQPHELGGLVVVAGREPEVALDQADVAVADEVAEEGGEILVDAVGDAHDLTPEPRGWNRRADLVFVQLARQCDVSCKLYCKARAMSSHRIDADPGGRGHRS